MVVGNCTTRCLVARLPHVSVASINEASYANEASPARIGVQLTWRLRPTWWLGRDGPWRVVRGAGFGRIRD